jgi:hypothetical protein
MKKLFFAFSFLFAITSQAQVIQKVNTYGFEYKRLEVDSFLRISLDTLSSAPDGSIAFLNHSTFVKDTIWKVIATPDGVTAVWGTIGGTIGDQTDLMSLLNAKVPKTTTLTIDGVAHDLSTNQSWGPFLNPADTQWLHDQVVNVTTYTNSLTFSDGLHQAGNNIVALHDEAHWNANRFQGRFVSTATPLNGQVYAWDSIGQAWKPTTITSGSSITAGYGLTGTTTFKVDTNLISTVAHLYKVADSLGALISGGGSTPSWDQTLTVSNSTTNSLLINNATVKHTATGSNIAFGKQNLGAVTTGKMNVAIGDSSLTGITTGSWNTAVGYQTLESTTTANGNTAIGRWALESITTGSNNTALGVNAGDFLTTGGNNTALGDNSAQRLTTGSNNILIGSVAGASIRTGQYNTIIGALHSQTDSDYSHHIVIGDGQYERLLIDSVGAWRQYTYGAGLHTGTATYGAAWDANGNLIEVATGGGGGGGSLPYQLLSIFMTQSGTSAPTITTLYNGVTGCSSVTATRAVSGGGVPAYTIHLNGISGAQGMTFNKTTVNGYMGVAWNGSNITSFPVGDGATVNGYVWMYWASIGTIELYCTDASGTAVEFSALFDSGQQLPFEIKIYP